MVAFDWTSFVVVAEDAAVELDRVGEADLVSVAPDQADSAPTGMRLAAAQTVDNRGLMFPMVPDTGRTTAEGYPIGNVVTSDLAIRGEVSTAIDHKALMALGLNGHGRPATGPMDGLTWDNPDTHRPGYAPADAMAMPDAAGWIDSNGDGTRDRDGRDVSFTIVYPASDSTRQALALGVQA